MPPSTGRARAARAPSEPVAAHTAIYSLARVEPCGRRAGSYTVPAAQRGFAERVRGERGENAERARRGRGKGAERARRGRGDAAERLRRCSGYTGAEGAERGAEKGARVQSTGRRGHREWRSDSRGCTRAESAGGCRGAAPVWRSQPAAPAVPPPAAGAAAHCHWCSVYAAKRTPMEARSTRRSARCEARR